MRKQRKILIALLMFVFLMNLVFATAVKAAEQPPVIHAIIPDKGIAGDGLTISGEGFGDQSALTGYSRYVRVGGFINTKIISWNNSAVKIIAPTLQEVTNDITRLNFFWLFADPVKLLSLASKLFDAAVSPAPTGVNNTVPVTVIIPTFRESNEGLFTYVAQSLVAGTTEDFNNLLAITYDTYGKDIVGLLSNPKELAKTKSQEFIRGLQEVPLFVRDLFTGKNPSQSSNVKKDNCDFSHYIIEYNEPQPTIEAVRDKITSLNIGWYSAMKDGNRNIIEIRGNEKDGPLTKAELDKLNKGFAELGIFKPLLFNSLETTNGVCGRQNEPIIIDPKDIEKLWENKQEGENITPQPNTQTPQLPQAQQEKIDEATITGFLIDELGAPVLDTPYKNSPDSPFGYVPHIAIINTTNNKVAWEEECYLQGVCLRSTLNPKTGSFTSKPLPASKYLLKVTIPGGYQKQEIILASKEFTIREGQNEVKLGNIVLTGTKF